MAPSGGTSGTSRRDRPPPLHLPTAYLAGFAAAALPGEAVGHVWAFRAAIGEWRRWPVARPDPEERHFNDADPAAFDRLAPLWEEQAALHATWRRKGALWRRAREEVVLEINGRTCAGAKQFLFSPQPAVPG